MWINSIRVTGEYHLFYEFKKKNILLGENGTGKSTFTKLILYALGVDIPDFIEEIVKYKYCDLVKIDFQTKSNNRYSVIRKLPYADMVMVTPYQNGILIEEEVTVYNLEEYSDFLLEEEQYSNEQVAYGNNQHASFRYRFVLRTAVVNQTTPHSKILANLGGSGSEYISNQKLINKAIIENILKQNNTEEQKIRLDLKDKEKQRAEINTKLKFYKELLDTYKETDEKYPIQLEKIDKELNNLLTERDNLSTQKYNTLLKLEHVSDKDSEKKIVKLRSELNEMKERQTGIKLEALDVEGALEKLASELEELKGNIAAKKVLKSIPVSICPVCFNDISESELDEGLCSKCTDQPYEEVLESLAKYKKMVEDSIKEANSLKKENYEKLTQLTQEIKNKEKVLNKLQETYFKKLTEIKEPLESLINEIKDRLNIIVERYYKLVELRKNIVVKNELGLSKDKLTSDISQLHRVLEDASKKSANEILVLEKWKELYEKIFKTVYSKSSSVSISSEDYMPIINENPVNKISSDSMKLVAQLAYILSLFQLQEHLVDEKINGVGFVIYDSPKDKDLDNDKYGAFLKELASSTEGQIFLTGSVKEKEVYKAAFSDVLFFPYLSEEDRLLKSE